MQFIKNKTAIVFVTGLFFVFDQLLKFFARTNQEFAWYIINPWLGWEYLANRGVALSLPIPNTFLLVITPILLVLLAWYYTTRPEKTNRLRLGAALIYAGAISNYIDRFLFEITIDYLRIYTSVFNIADVIIVVGVVCLLFVKEKRPAQ